MAGANFLSRFKPGHNAQPDPNSRHARMASASSTNGQIPTSSSSSLTGKPLVASPPSTAALPPQRDLMPRLVLTTGDEDQDHHSINLPGTPSTKKSPSILDDKEETLSPDETRSSEEAQHRLVSGQTAKSGPPRPIGALNFTPSPQSQRTTDDLATPTANRHFTDNTPKANGSSLPAAAASSNRATTMGAADPSSQAKKGLAAKASNTDMRRSAAEDSTSPSTSFEGTRSRSNTQLLALPSDGDGGISDTASIISASGKKKKKLWRKASSSSIRKPTSGSALGAALAASGMSLAHPTSMPIAQTPTVSPERLRQDTAKVTQPNRHNTTASSRPFGFRRGSGDTDMDSEGAYDSDSHDGMSFADHDIPITGFAVASSKRNADFHDIFPDVPEGDYLIEDYGCALQREILVQGRMYISENHICFHANIFGWVTNFTIPFTNVVGLEKKMTAFVIPNAIQINTTDQKYVFASFLSRDTTFDVIGNIWRLAHPGATVTTKDGTLSINAASDAASIAAPSIGSGGATSTTAAVPGSPVVTTTNGATAGLPKKSTAHRATQCECGKNRQHYAETAMDSVFPGTPEKLYNLIFASGFAKEFMAQDQKLMSIQVSDWSPAPDGSGLLSRNMSYIKPLNGSVGPKQTKCELREETVHVDFDNWVSTVTTTRTPDVPSGGSFSVKTRTCIMWAGPTTTRIVVTTVVEWTGRSFLKSIIERSCIDGQRTYHGDLERAMRQYISQHTTEFLPEGAEDTTIAAALTPDPNAADSASNPLSPTLEKSPDQLNPTARGIVERRGMQWALDTFTNAMKLTSQSFWGLIDIIQDVWEAAPDASGVSWWLVVVVGLVAMNVWTYTSLSQLRAREALTKKNLNVAGPGYGKAAGERGVAREAVRVFWEEVVERQNLKWKEDLMREVDALREEVRALRESTMAGATSSAGPALD